MAGKWPIFHLLINGLFLGVKSPTDPFTFDPNLRLDIPIVPRKTLISHVRSRVMILLLNPCWDLRLFDAWKKFQTYSPNIRILHSELPW